jgi:pyruvate formate lyase activating enzyme
MISAESALVFDVQRFSIHDGPGIRTVVFFKGCSLDCVWCQNPEGVRCLPEMAYYPERCLPACAACLDQCPESALRADRLQRIDFARCTVCGRCVDVCPAEALRQVGRAVSAAALLDEVLKDRLFYAHSGGGITLSGGEPVLHADFLFGFLPRARAAGLHVALETAGNYPFARVEPLLPLVDLVLFDLKLADPERHRRFTGRGNHLVIATLRELIARDVPLRVRMPAIPGLNTNPADIAGMAGLLLAVGVRDLVLLPYNHLWEAKLPRLGDHRRGLGIEPPDPSFYAGLLQQFGSAGVRACL